MATFVWTTRVRYVDTDTSGRIHYTSLFRYFEAAEQEFLRGLGHGYPGYAGAAEGWPRVHAECDISGALAFEDEIQIELAVGRLGNSSMELIYRVLKEGTECAKGRIVIVHMSRATGKSKSLPPDFVAALREYAAR